MAREPFLTTERLELYRPHRDDIAPMFAIISEPETARYLGPPSDMADHFARVLRNAGSWELYGYGGLMVRRKGQSELLGNCGIFHSWRGLGEDFDDCPEAGWILGASHTGQGYASEAMRAVLDWFDTAHGPRRIVCMIEPGNTASLALARKLGFDPYRKAELKDGEEVQLLSRVAPL